VSVAVTVPPAVALKAVLDAPFLVSVPVNVSVVVGVDGVVGVVGVVGMSLLSSHPATLIIRAHSRIPGNRRRISSP
jgi:hypothetical protein